MAIILAMTEVLPLADVRNRLSEIVERVVSQQDRVTVTRNGRPAVVVLSVDDLESIEETLAILSERGTSADIREAVADEGEVLTKEEALGRWGAG